MTLDDLVKIFDKAEAEIEWVLKEGDGQRAGIRAVFEALRDELCKRSEYNWVNSDLRKEFNEILTVAGEVAAGGSANTVDAQQCQISTTSPAADVCEWTDAFSAAANSKWKVRGCDAVGFYSGDLDGSSVCPSCGKPIKFKETP